MRRTLTLAAGLVLAMAGSTTETRAEPAPCSQVYDLHCPGQYSREREIRQSIDSLEELISDRRSREVFLHLVEGTRMERAIVLHYRQELLDDPRAIEDMLDAISTRRPELVRRYASKEDCKRQAKKSIKRAYEKTSQGIKHILDKGEEAIGMVRWCYQDQREDCRASL